MFRKLIATDNDATITILRLVLGVVFFAHGAQKLLGWFGGYGFTGTMGFFTGMMHIPAHSRFWQLRQNSSVDWVLSSGCSLALRPLESSATWPLLLRWSITN